MFFVCPCPRRDGQGGRVIRQSQASLHNATYRLTTIGSYIRCGNSRAASWSTFSLVSMPRGRDSDTATRHGSGTSGLAGVGFLHLMQDPTLPRWPWLSRFQASCRGSCVTTASSFSALTSESSRPKAPGNSYYVYYSAHYWANESVTGSSAGGYWRVAVSNYGSTTGYMNKAKTYAYCADGS